MDILFINIDERCNCECPFCFYNTGYLRRRESLLSENHLAAVIDDAIEMRVKGIIFTGGEPLMGGEKRLAMIERLVRKAREGGVYTLLLTNGSYLKPGSSERLAEAGLGGVSVGLDTLSGIEGYKIAGWRGVEAALAQDLRVTVIMTLTSENYVDLAAIYRFAATRGLGLILQPAFIPGESPLFDKISLHTLPSSELESLFEKITGWAKNFGMEKYLGYFKGLYDLPGGTKPASCEMGSNVGIVEPDGSVVPCFHRRDIVAGNIGKERLADIAEKLREISAPLADAHCFGEHCVSLFTN